MKRFAFLLVILLACSPATQPSKQSTSQCPQLGFAFYPGAVISSNAKHYVDVYKEHANLLLLHFGDSVPWELLARCDDLATCTLDDSDLNNALTQYKAVITSLQQQAHAFPGKTYLAISPLNNERNGVATTTDGERALGYTAPADNFADDTVHKLYKKYADYLIRTFKPDYFSQGIEFNMYATARPDDFTNLVELLKETKTAQSIGPTIQWEFFKRDYDTNNETLRAVLASWHDLGTGYAISTYPHIFGQPLEEHHYDFASYGFDLTKPLFISEAGAPNHQQQIILDQLFTLNLQGVIWFFLEDADAWTATLPDEYPYTAFKNIGLIDDTGEPHAGLAMWDAQLACTQQ